MALSRPARLVLALLALVAPALVVLGTAPPSYAAPGLCPAVLDCTAPTAEIYRHRTADAGGLEIAPGGRTTARTAVFWARPADLANEPHPQGVTYTCRLEKDGTVVQDWTSLCTEEPAGPDSAALARVALEKLVPGTYTLSIRAKDDATVLDLGLIPAPNEQAEPGTQFTWTVDEPVDDRTPPRTRITAGLKRWHLAPFASVDYTADEPLATARCYLGATRRKCDSAQATILGLTSGDHVFKVAGVDYAENVDPTPAVNRFTVPVPSGKLKASKGWKRGTDIDYFFSGYSTTKKKGATLSAARAGTKSVVLVVTTCRGCGSVKVTYGGKVLKRVSLATTRTKHRQVVPIVRWASGHGGRVSVTVTSSGKPVTIEGLGFSKRR